MKKYFQNLDVQCWRHTGARLGWSQHCLCMQAVPEAIATLVLAVDELAADGPPGKRALTLRSNDRPKQCSTIRMSLVSAGDDLRKMCITRDDEVAKFEFTDVGLSEFREALIAWQNGGEDFCVYPRGAKHELGNRDRSSVEIWFWTPATDP